MRYYRFSQTASAVCFFCPRKAISLDKTFIYKYNNIGNIVKVKEYDFTLSDTPSGTCTEKPYAYDSTYPDRLTNFNGKSINYDTLGRVSYYDGKSYNWSDGRLSSFGCGSASQGGALYDNCIFTYDGYGRRTRKHHIYDINPKSTSDYSYYETRDYTYDNSGRLVRDYYTHQFTYAGASAPTTKEFIFLYDESSVIGVRYINNGASTTDYYYVKNLLGDVTAIYDTNGNLITEYAYDAYGNCTVIYGNSSEISRINPIRYRSYYYDTDTGLYYLNARYYNPQWRRFISPADISTINHQTVSDLNLYCYASNEPFNKNNRNVILSSRLGLETNLISQSLNIAGQSLSVFGALMSMSYAFGSFSTYADMFSGLADGTLRFFDSRGIGYAGLDSYSDMLSKFGKGMLIAGSILSWGSSVYNNFNNPYYSSEEIFYATMADAGYYALKGVGTYYAGNIVSCVASSAGILAAGYSFLYLGVSFGVGLVIGGGVALLIGGLGAGLIIYIGDKLDEGWSEIKKWLFE